MKFNPVKYSTVMIGLTCVIALLHNAASALARRHVGNQYGDVEPPNEPIALILSFFGIAPTSATFVYFGMKLATERTRQSTQKIAVLALAAAVALEGMSLLVTNGVAQENQYGADMASHCCRLTAVGLFGAAAAGLWVTDSLLPPIANIHPE